MKDQTMTMEDEAFLEDLEALFAEADVAPLPLDLEIALKQQTHDRLQPVRSSVGEVLVAALAGVFVLAVSAEGSWGIEQMLVLVPTVVAYCAATLAFAGERDGVDG